MRRPRVSCGRIGSINAGFSIDRINTPGEKHVLPGLFDNIYPDCGRRVAGPCLAPAPRASAACLFEPAASAVLQSVIVARWRRCATHVPPVRGNLANRLCRKFSQPSSNFAQASVVDAAYVTFGSGGPEPLAIAWCLRFAHRPRSAPVGAF